MFCAQMGTVKKCQMGGNCPFCPRFLPVRVLYGHLEASKECLIIIILLKSVADRGKSITFTRQKIEKRYKRKLIYDKDAIINLFRLLTFLKFIDT